jgi:CheY-like chemotaxis protein
VFEKEWPILVVDDDQDVLSVSKLAMKNFHVDGRPIRLFTATSKEEAIGLLTSSLSGRLFPYVAVAFIDVVMETDTAGLELCQFIRETQRNRMTQLYIRTGQPGVAPERSVIDRYDINGYFTKVELTEDKLYSLVKAGVRQFDFTNMSIGAFEVVTRAIAASDSLDNLARSLNGALEQMPLDAAGSRIHDYHQQVSVIVGDRVLTAAGYSEAQARAERDRLERLGLQTIDSEGNGYVVDGKTFMVKVRATEANDDAYHIMNIVGAPSVADVLIVRVFTKAIAALARRTEMTARREVAVAG